MVRIVGPFNSQSAHGKFAGVLVATRTRGLNVFRQLVTPSNPMTAGQKAQRSILQVSGRAVFRMSRDQVGQSTTATQTPLEFLQAAVVLPDTWNSTYNRLGYPSGGDMLLADWTAWEALESLAQAAWGTFNVELANPFTDLTIQSEAITSPIVGGFQAFTFCRALFRAGYLETLPNQTPPDWDNTLSGVRVSPTARRQRGNARGKSPPVVAPRKSPSTPNRKA